MADETDTPGSTRDEHGRWRKGYTANPKGRPAGSRHKTTLAIEALGWPPQRVETTFFHASTIAFSASAAESDHRAF